MPEFVPEATPSTPREHEEALTVNVGDSLPKLLAMPHSPLSERLKRAALDLKETVPIPFIFFSLAPQFSYMTPSVCIFVSDSNENMGISRATR